MAVTIGMMMMIEQSRDVVFTASLLPDCMGYYSS